MNFIRFAIAASVATLVFSGSILHAEETSRDFIRMLVGSWKVSGTAAGEELSGRFQFKQTDIDSCLVSTYKAKLGDKSISGRHITGWDSATDSVRAMGFFSHGVMEDLEYKRVSPGVGKGTYNSSKDGETSSASLTVTFSEDEVKFETNGMKRAGKPFPELVAVFTRIKK